MDFFDLLLQAGLVTTALVSYLIFFRKSSPNKFKGNYREPGWNYFFRYLGARYAVRKWKRQRPDVSPLEESRRSQPDGWDCITIRTSAPDGSTVILGIRKLNERKPLAEVTVFVKLADGTSYQLPQHPDTVVGPWEDTAKVWKAGGLKIEILENQLLMRVIFNGLLKRNGDGVVQHAKFNFVWSAGSEVSRFPEDWSNKLAAHALALDPWRDGDWPATLDKLNYGSWLHWGVLQGRFESYDNEGRTDRSEYLRLRGSKKRSWSPRGYNGLRRTVTFTAIAKDGTMVELRGFSYKNMITIGYSGSVRYPDGLIGSVTGTDLQLKQFCESPDDAPAAHTINVSTPKKDLKLIVRFNKDSCKVLSGVPYQYEIHFRTMHVDIDGEVGTGIFELGYQHTGKSSPRVHIPEISLRWSRECDVPAPQYCATFESAVAACPAIVGGKGASLALLAAVQKDMGYKVPPGFCLTTKSLEKHLEANPQLKSAILEIEAVTENYDEAIFKNKCKTASELFAKTDLVEDVKKEILEHLADLRNKAAQLNLGSELRFAVRSSAVGEDSEALSAAGQNETILGCVSDEDVLKGVQLCWGSMFAFTSAHYRRQNGQACLCGGGVVIQALVRARAAGVMFTRAPPAAHPGRLLITANYGLGESVVSGAVEPDTIIVARDKQLTIAKIEIGSKKQRMRAVGDSVMTEDVSEAEQKLPCISVEEALALAKIGVAQEEAWGAGRDIEWAVTDNGIYLLQARPITSLESWTEEELLHELDNPIMSDDDLNTFANTGEVMPKPMTAFSYDLVYKALDKGINKLLGCTKFDGTVASTHYRGVLPLYNSMYRVTPKEISMAIRMSEVSVYGHKLLDDHMLAVAQHRRPHSRLQDILQMLFSFKHLIMTKWCMKDAIKAVEAMKVNMSLKDPLAMLEDIMDQEGPLNRCMVNHASTSSGSTISQCIAMIVMVEGASDFGSEHCNEINVLLSSGGVLSAEVPQALAKLAQLLEDSGKKQEFSAQEPKQALGWLKDNIPNVYKEVTKFLEEHGHRAIMEFDFATKPWALVPEEMMVVLQNMQVMDQQKATAKTDQEIIDSLKTPQKSSTRKALRWLLPLVRRTVRHRENTKAHLILAIHKIRLALRRLGHALHQRWYIPDPELVFHFRVSELREYLLDRDPALLKKAMQRQKHHPSWCKLQFAETHTGWVLPLAARAPRVTAGGARLHATPVCGGEVIARACVVKDLSEIGQLQRGDVLITHSTDIGWSPYFPLLSGIVTELGGLISHGAVIAREYGLPCLVGAADATAMFATGDTVRLAANRGLLETVHVADIEPDTEP